MMETTFGPNARRDYIFRYHSKLKVSATFVGPLNQRGLRRIA